MGHTTDTIANTNINVSMTQHEHLRPGGFFLSFFSEIRVVYFRRDSFRADLEVKQNSLRQRTLPLPWKIPLNLPLPLPTSLCPGFCPIQPSPEPVHMEARLLQPPSLRHQTIQGAGHGWTAAGSTPLHMWLRGWREASLQCPGHLCPPTPAGRPPGGWAGDPRGALPTVHSPRLRAGGGRTPADRQ